MFSHDGATLANHSHIVMTGSAMYDAVYIADQEYFKNNKKSLNIQTELEKPYLYLMGCCPLNEQQFLYSEERVKDIRDMAEHFV